MPKPASFPTGPSDGPQSRYDDLLQTATDLFSRHGYERTTVRMIADELGIQSGSLYSHISGKEEVLRRIVFFVGEDFLTRLAQARESASTAEEALGAICRAHLDVLNDNFGAVTVYFNEWQNLSVKTREEIIELRERYERHFADVIAEGVKTGEFEVVDSRAVVRVVLSALNWTYKWYRPGGDQTPHEIADGYLQVILAGLRPRPSSD